MIREIRTAAGIIPSLYLPHYDPILDVYVPGARSCAVNAMSGADFFIVLPSSAVKFLPLPLPAAHLGPIPGNIFRAAM
jgi:hypothetical protein